ncbi:MAG: WecB/TagA/CpsF family glycosyltransferase [Alphaproteobacteria bacterium]|nr:WecB/TagA/CpsF family glycosyltransferase [Alphaproteobacteria bacterium]
MGAARLDQHAGAGPDGSDHPSACGDVQAAMPRRELFGVPFTPLTLDAAAEIIAERPSGLPFHYVVTPNSSDIVRMQREPERLCPVWRGAFLCLLDSAIVQLLAKGLGEDIPVAAGSDLTARLFESGIVMPDEPLTVIGCRSAALDRLKARYGLRHVLHHDPPMGFIDDATAVARAIDFVVEARTRFVFLAIGGPQAQILACKIRQDGRAIGLGFCIGASLNFLAGVQSRAPLWMRRSRLEWLFRTIQEPRRFGRRMLFDALPILGVAAREGARRWRRTGAAPQ